MFMKVKIELITDEGAVFHGDANLIRVTSRSTQTRISPSPLKSGKVSCRDAVRQLWQKGKFGPALSFSDVKNELAKDGFNFPNNTLMMALSTATYLTRRGS